MGIGYVIKQAVHKELENGILYEIKVKQKLPTLKLNLVYIEEYLTHIPKSFMKTIEAEYKEYMK